MEGQYDAGLHGFSSAAMDRLESLEERFSCAASPLEREDVQGGDCAQ
jgi:hypothetical protein